MTLIRHFETAALVLRTKLRDPRIIAYAIILARAAEKRSTGYKFEKENSRAAAYDGSIFTGECDVLFQKSFWIITHTEVDSAYNGQGMAGRLVACVMDAAKEAGIRTGLLRK